MEQCRICLKNRKRLRCLFENNDGLKYSDMINSLTNVKVMNDGATDKACMRCCQSIVDAYQFKILIERSDAALQELFKSRRLVFNNINDIKTKLNLPEYNNSLENEIIIKYEDIFNHHNTIIKRNYVIEYEGTKPQNEVLDAEKEDSERFYEENAGNSNYEPEEDSDHSSLYSDGLQCNNKSDQCSDDEYIPHNYTYKRKKKLIKSKKLGPKPCPKPCQKKRTRLEKPIKPNYLKNIEIKIDRKKENNSKEKKLKKQSKKICPYCGKLIPNSYLEIHILRHEGERKFQCPLCPKSFYTAASLKHHEYVHIAREERKYRCDKCTAAFNLKDYLKSHMMIHTQIKEQICDICNKAFRRKSQMRRHKALIHNIGCEQYKCEQCERTCKTKTNLKHHMRVHTGERPFKCEMGPRSTRTSDLYVSAQHCLNGQAALHLENKKNNIKEYSFNHWNMAAFEKAIEEASDADCKLCYICSQPYSYKHDFNRHCLKKHGVYFKRRSVYVLNEEVLAREREIMRDLMTRIHDLDKSDLPQNPFEGPQAAMAYEDIKNALATKLLPINFQF